MSKLEDFGAQLFASMEGYVLRAIAPLALRLSEVEAKAPLRGEKGDPGEPGAPGQVGERGLPGPDGARGLDGAVGERGPAGERGEKGDPGERGLDGKTGVDGKDGLPGERGEPGERGLDGKDGPDGQHGVDGKDGAPGRSAFEISGFVGSEIEWLASLKGLDGARGVDGKDGRDGREGRDGKDGADGVDGKDAAELFVLSSIDPAKIYPRGTWARHLRGLWLAVAETSGMEGWQCIVAGVASLEFEFVGRSLMAVGTLSDGTKSKAETRLPHFEDRGVFKEGEDYWRGDGVTYAGSIFIAQVDHPTEKPEMGSEWRLAVKRGREGKEGKQGPRGEQGQKGERGEYVR